MNLFRTPLTASSSKNSVDLSHQVLTVGSCFSDAIGERLKANKIDSLINPFGTVYNAHSIHKILQYATIRQLPARNTYVQRADLFLNYDFHSEFCSVDLINLEQRLKNTIEATNSFLKKARWVMITYGTAWIYERKDTGEAVANCHKLPQDMFIKSLLNQEKIVQSFESMYGGLKALNPEIKFILTVSPVRHLKDTLELNSVSKSVLRMACHTLVQSHDDVDYFPAYEIMLDDLRDYRFYKGDMIHPSEVAEEYIWEKFADRYFDEKSKSFLYRWKEIRAALAHQPFHVSSAAHQKFLSETLKKLEELKGIVNVDQEIMMIKTQIIDH
jgi:hypothetical protein